ncbi:MAG TPA: 50S ribosomal protein L11 methyltransferase [bacterium]|jgi:ribosomal protein L11 methyltransferase|nr:methyltransferase domain-containing protein [Myxococcales bacterium]OQA61861.1 MAG: Ribosomal protein L11 methyltransferase [bacterium ADurb.Bin270]HPW45662.1 50S ribosomal protein L11 methyltransferase [bacterium]HQC51282.1 50S ribosomal protein L11 methyltransferase [bacterium]
MGKLWHIAKFESPKTTIEKLTVFLHDTEVAGIMEEDKEDTTLLTAYYDPDRFDLIELKKIFDQFLILPENSKVRASYETAELDDWTESWKQWFSPFEIVPGITISPTWEDEAVPSENKIIIDPKMAFGTGLHPTTKLCASEIHRLSRRGERRSLIDVGTGSGILAMVAGKLAFSPISAVENDPVAAEIASENFSLNGMPEIKVLADISMVKKRYDVVVANILLSTLTELRDELLNILAPRGSIVLSGITHDQADDILKIFSETLSLRRHDKMGEWSSMTFTTEESE